MGDSGSSAGYTHMDTRGEWVTGCSAGNTHMDTRGQCGDSGCSAGDTHMNTRGQCVTVAVVLPINIWIHVASV